jgi:DNA-binding FrmR family transcriptional regulator
MANQLQQSVTDEQIRARLRRIEGQVRGIARMLETNRSCEDIVTQLMAVRASMDTVGALVLDTHLGTCIGDGNPQEQVRALRDAMRLWWRFAPTAGAMGAAANEVGAYSPLPELGQD